MALTFELASFAVAEAAETALMAERESMIAALQRSFPGLLAAWLTKQDNGTWLDIVLWRSREQAEEAARGIDDVPEAKRWFRHITASKGIRHVTVAEEHLFGLRRADSRSSPDPE